MGSGRLRRRPLGPGRSRRSGNLAGKKAISIESDTGRWRPRSHGVPGIISRTTRWMLGIRGCSGISFTTPD